MPPNFLIDHNEIKIAPMLDGNNSHRFEIWRIVVAVAVVLFSVGLLIIKKIDFSQKQVVMNKVVTPLVGLDFSSQPLNADLNIKSLVQFKPRLPELQGEMISCNDFSAKSIIVKDQKSGAVLLKKNEYEKRPIASITKLMSALVLIERNLDWNTSTIVSPDKVVDTHMYAGDTYTLLELWQAALVGSSNKAVLTLVDASGLSRQAFVQRMNEKAKELGMLDTSFTDPTGLEDTDIATASDLSILISEALKSDRIRNTLNIKEIDLYSKERKHKEHIWNTDWLLLNWIPNQLNLRGGKTGYIPAAGYNFTMQVGDDKGHVINVVVLGADNYQARFTECRDIAKWVFESYQWPE
jgi:D-alanyl-D-alanine endopeptidase (penicillin-binding protein 7)